MVERAKQSAPRMARTIIAVAGLSSQARSVPRMRLAMLTRPRNISLKTRASAEREKARGDMKMHSPMLDILDFLLVSVAASSVRSVFSGRKMMMKRSVLPTLERNALSVSVEA